HFGSLYRVGHEHRDGLGPYATGYGRDRPSHFSHFGMNIANQGGAFGEESLRPLGIAGEKAIELGAFGDLVHADIDYRGAGVYKVAGNHSRPADGGDQDVGATAHAGKIAGLGM